jgi:putative transposase
VFAERLKAKRPAPSPRWHLDEVQIQIAGKKHYIWRAVDDEGEVLDCVVSKRRTMPIALELMQKLLANQPVRPAQIVTDQYQCYVPPLYFLGLRDIHVAGTRHENNRAENSHLQVRKRERKMQGFKSVASAQRFLDVHGVIYNTFNVQPHIASRGAFQELRRRAFAVWDEVTA